MLSLRYQSYDGPSALKQPAVKRNTLTVLPNSAAMMEIIPGQPAGQFSATD